MYMPNTIFTKGRFLLLSAQNNHHNFNQLINQKLDIKSFLEQCHLILNDVEFVTIVHDELNKKGISFNENQFKRILFLLTMKDCLNDTHLFYHQIYIEHLQPTTHRKALYDINRYLIKGKDKHKALVIKRMPDSRYEIMKNFMLESYQITQLPDRNPGTSMDIYHYYPVLEKTTLMFQSFLNNNLNEAIEIAKLPDIHPYLVKIIEASYVNDGYSKFKTKSLRGNYQIKQPHIHTKNKLKTLINENIKVINDNTQTIKTKLYEYLHLKPH